MTLSLYRDSPTRFSALGFCCQTVPLGPLIHGRSQFFFVKKSQTLFYCHGVGKITYCMTDFWIDCYLKGFCKGRKNFV
jgi:hypothetical protein